MTDLVGAIGVTLLLLAFALNSRGLLGSDSRAYHAMNVVGASLSCLASWWLDYLPFVVLEGAWAAVALAALVTGPRRPQAASDFPVTPSMRSASPSTDTSAT